MNMDKAQLKPFDAIRPFEPDELPAVYERLIGNDQFRAVAGHVFPGVPFDMLAAKMRSCATNIDFQKAFCYAFLKNLLAKASLGCDFDSSEIDLSHRHTFVSNHRDIVLDSALLDMLLVDNGSTTTCEIAIGDNLLSLPWVKDLVRINKSFIVERAVGMRQMLVSSKRLSEYMHLVVGTKHDNVWIAQREGRAKDSDDRTQESIIKMMAMGGEGSLVERIRSLHIVPLAISYEFDPCDFLKAREYQLRRDVEGWKKGPTDDIVSMQTGIMGYKGHIHYHAAQCIDAWLDTLDADMPKGEFFAAVARHIDEQIFSRYRLYPNNFVALDELSGTTEHAGCYTQHDKERFDAYIAGQLARIDIPCKDEQYLRERMLTMYANPARNQLSLCGTTNQ
ncbi:MAG: 1-acyl-sn-glycerol-3-phosphate acyltransferase [Prevotella sp.]|nr:1-acyl-sn-glycerol-3-phosphate acyltransferase [Prevotella sp.]